MTAGAWGSLVSAGFQLASAFAYEADVQEFEYETQEPVDNSTAVYNRAYASMVQKRNALELMHKGEMSATAAKLRGVKERTAIGLTQDEAAAQVKMNAAVAGVKGGSVDDSVYQTYANAAFRLSDQAINENNNIEKALVDVYNGNQASATKKDDYSVESNFTGGNDTVAQGSEFSWAGAVMGQLGQLDNQWFKDLGLALEDTNTPMDRTSIPGGMGGV